MNKNEVSVSKLVEQLDLKEYTDGLDLKKRKKRYKKVEQKAKCQLLDFVF